MRLSLTMAVVLAAAALLAIPAGAEPTPSEVSISWELDILLEGLPRAIQVRVPAKATPQVFWYLRYTVTNRTGQDQVFVPDFSLYTDTAQVVPTGRGVHPVVFETIKKLHNDVFLLDTTGMTGKLLQGSDNAKSGVAIWKDFDPKAGMFDVFVGGLSGEATEVVLPVPILVKEVDVMTGENIETVKDRAILTKTLRLSCSIPGEASSRLQSQPTLIARDWVMR